MFKKAVIAGSMIIASMSVFAENVHLDSEPVSGQVLQSTPCKGVKEGQQKVFTATDGQSVSLICHHMLPQA